MPYKGRVLVINILSASKHWIRAAQLYLPPCEGGQGLIDIKSRIQAFGCFQPKKLLCRKDLVWTRTAGAILRSTEGLNYDLHLFWIQTQEMDLTEITSFNKSVLQAWVKTFKIKRVFEIPKYWVLEEPLFHNPLVHGTLMFLKSVEENMLRRNCTKLKELFSLDGWKSVEEITVFTGLRS